MVEVFLVGSGWWARVAGVGDLGQCVRDSTLRLASLTPKTVASSFNPFLSVVKKFQSLSGWVHLPHLQGVPLVHAQILMPQPEALGGSWDSL